MTWIYYLVPIALGLSFQHFFPAEWMRPPSFISQGFRSVALFARKSLQGPEAKSQALIKAIFDLERQLQSGCLKQEKALPEYKNYTALLNNLLSSQRRFGVPLRDALGQLRDFLRHEGRFSRKWEEQRSGGQFQLLLMSLISWLFIKTSLSVLEIEMSWLGLSSIAAIHLSGFFVYRYGLVKISTLFFGKLFIFQEVVFRFRIYRRSGLPTKVILQEVAPGDLETNGGSLHSLTDQLFELIRQWRESGVSIEEELKGLEDEVSLRLELNRDKALKWEKGLRLLALLLFFVIPYLGYLFFLLNSLSA